MSRSSRDSAESRSEAGRGWAAEGVRAARAELSVASLLRVHSGNDPLFCPSNGRWSGTMYGDRLGVWKQGMGKVLTVMRCRGTVDVLIGEQVEGRAAGSQKTEGALSPQTEASRTARG